MSAVAEVGVAPDACPDEQTLVDYAAGELQAKARAEIEGHLDRCSTCAHALADFVRIFGTPAIDSAPDDPSEVPTTVDDRPVPVDGSLVLPAGSMVGRYRVLECVGRGGMGVVYSAYDPQLDRRVAIKVLQAHAGRDAPQRRMRLLREAQALARLSHPNVIAVYDVGTVDDPASAPHVFVAMEFVEGQSLRQWLKGGRRSWPEIRDVFAAAGRGLAAAHAAGLVHRDFKPDNVLIGAGASGRDLRVYVTDFGLARVGATVETPLPHDSGDQPARSATSLTLDGALLGTPAYMAPEQLAGGHVFARSDQYAFCVALYEAITGQRPFSGRTVAELAQAVLEREAELGVTLRVPPRVRFAVLRGLSRDPAQRFADMNQLVAVLVGGGPVRRAAALVGTGVVALALGVGVGTHTSAPDGPPVCADDWLGDVWNEDVASVIGGRFAQGPAFAQVSWTTVRADLDDHANRLLAVRDEVCAPSDVPLDPELAARRFACLDERAGELAVVLGVLAEIEPKAVQDAVRVPRSLGDPRACDQSSTGDEADPPDPRIASSVGELRLELERSDALLAAGRFPDAFAIVEATMTAADELGYEPLRADVLLRRGRLLDRTSKHAESRAVFYQAIAAATASRHREVAVQGWVELVYVLGRIEHRFEEAHVAAEQARAEIAASGGNRDAEAARLTNLGSLLFTESRFDEALTAYHDALAIREELEQRERVTDIRFNIANVEMTLAHYDDALRDFEACLEDFMRTVGPDHPEVADVHHSLGVLHGYAGRPAQAVHELEAALRVREQAYGKDGSEVAVTLGALGDTYAHLGRIADAVALVRRALAIDERTYGPHHPMVAGRYGQLADILRVSGALPEARKAAEHALAILGGDADALVAHDDRDAIAVVHEHDVDGAAGAILERVRQQVGDGLIDA
ncbi:MAG TPA: tetratricopeptide repeat protein, partial [Nannocystaceae bacterium]|nr:tetratricopeptide repeat protein [Nannocystaceae bacterium]